MTSDPRVVVTVQFFDRYFRGDVEGACQLLDPEVTYRVAGTHSPPAGVFHGLSGVSEHLGAFLRLNEAPVDLLKWVDWLTGAHYVAALASIHIQRAGQAHDFAMIFLVQVSDEGRITEIEVFFSDQAAADRFYVGQSAL